MYCPSCGLELTQELSYCNRCGANLKPSSDPLSNLTSAKPGGVAWAISLAIAVVTLGGFFMIFGLVLTIINRGISLSAGGMGLVFFSLLIIFAIDLLLVRQLSRFLEIPRLSGHVPPVKMPDEKFAPQISAPREPVSSVTEHTTRTFEPVQRKRETQR